MSSKRKRENPPSSKMEESKSKRGYENLCNIIRYRDSYGPSFRNKNVEPLHGSSFRKLHLGTLSNDISSNPLYISRLELKAELIKHTGCVNTIQWNHNGGLLVSGSDDCKLNIWSGGPSYKLHQTVMTGHRRNIFSAVFVPGTNDQKVVSTGMDGEVRMCDLTKDSPTLLGKFQHMVYRIFFMPDSNGSTFLTTHQDGFVRLFDIRQKGHEEQTNMVISFKSGRRNVSANTLAYSPLNPNLFIVGGADPMIRLFDMRFATSSDDTSISKFIRQYCPRHIVEGERPSAYENFYVTGVDFNDQNEFVATYSREDVYLFDASDGQTEEQINKQSVVVNYMQRYKGRRNVQTFLKEVCFFGNNSYVATGCDSGHLFIWDKTSASLVNCLKADENVVNGVSPHPSLPILATCGIDSSAKVFEPGDKVTFKPTKAEKIIKENEQTNEQPEESVSLLNLWDLLASLRRHGVTINPADLLGGDFDDSESESSASESESDSDREFTEQQGLARVTQSDNARIAANDLFKKGRYEEALDQYTKSRDLLTFRCDSATVHKKVEDSMVLCLLNTAACALKLGDNELVINDCTTVLESQPSNAKALYRRGCAYIKQKQYELAKADLDKAHEANPQDETISTLLEKVNKKVQKNEKQGSKDESKEEED